MILHYLPAAPDSLAPRRACSVEAMIGLGTCRRPIIRSTERSSAGAKLSCAPGRVVQNRRSTQPSSQETAGNSGVDVGSERRQSLAGPRLGPTRSAHLVYFAYLAQIHAREKRSSRSIHALGREKGVRGEFGWPSVSQGRLRASESLWAPSCQRPLAEADTAGQDRPWHNRSISRCAMAGLAGRVFLLLARASHVNRSTNAE